MRFDHVTRIAVVLCFTAALTSTGTTNATVCDAVFDAVLQIDVVDVTDCGATPAVGDDHDDSTAINDALAQLGAAGGRVHFPPGEYEASNIQHPSNVEIHGDNRATTTIKNAQPNTNLRVIEGKLYSEKQPATITGDITAGSKVLTVNDATNIPEGAIVGVRGAGGRDLGQSSTLALPMLATGGPITLTGNSEDWANISESKFLLVENELIQYESRNGQVFSTLTRGVHTTKVAHAAGKPVGHALRLVGQVDIKNGNTLTLDSEAKISVNDAIVTVGSINMSLRGLTIEGDQEGPHTGVGDAQPVEYALSRWVTVEDSTFTHTELGGVELSSGTRDSVIQNNLFVDNGDAQGAGGANVFLFGGAIRNRVEGNTLTGPTHFGIFVDDRSEKSNQYDGQSDENLILNNRIQQSNAPIAATGIRLDGNDNVRDASPNIVVSGNIVCEGTTGISVGSYDPQGIVARKTADSLITLNTLEGQSTAIASSGVNNTFSDNIIRDAGDDIHDTGTSNTFTNNDDPPPGTACPVP